MKLIFHDLLPETAERLLPKNSTTQLISDNGTIHPCTGCFGCWVKTPGQCVIRDSYQNLGEVLSKCDELIIISRCCYGGFSPFVKNVLDRSIGYIHPYFKIRQNEMHHKRRYDNCFNLSVFFYGSSISNEDRRIAQNLVHANALNFDCRVKRILFEPAAESFAGKIE